MNQPETTTWINGYERDLNVKFSDDTREVLHTASSEFSGEDYEVKGLITPAIVLACLSTGKNQLEQDGLLATLFRIVGSEKYDELGTRYNIGGSPGPELIELANTSFPEESQFVGQIFQHAARAIPRNRTEFLPVDFLVTLTESLSENPDEVSDCPVLNGSEESFASTLFRWLDQLSNSPSFPADLSKRLRGIRFSGSINTQSRSPSGKRPGVTPSIYEWLEMSPHVTGLNFSSDLKTALEIAHKGVTGSESKVGVTTPRLLIAAAMTADAPNASSEFARQFANVISADRLRKMKLALSQNYEMYGDGEFGRLADGIKSTEVTEIISQAKSPSNSNHNTLSLEDVLRAMLAKRPSDCEVFAKDRNVDEFWREFEGWIDSATSASTSNSKTASDTKSQPINQPPLLSGDWITDFQSQNKMIFSGATRELIQLAGTEYRAGVSSPETKGITAASIFLAAIKTGETRPKRDIFLSKFYKIVGAESVQQMRACFGDGDMAGSEVNEIANKSDRTISDSAHRILQQASKEPSGQENKILPVDILVSLAEDLANNPGSASSCDHLVANGDSFVSLLRNGLSALSGTPDFPPELKTRLRKINYPSVDRDRAFSEIRNPKNFKWSASCGRILDSLWHSYGIAGDFSRQSAKRAEQLNSHLTPRALFLSALLYGTSDSSGKVAHGLLGLLFSAAGKSADELRSLLNEEFHHGADGTKSSNPIATESFFELIDLSNEIRKSTGDDDYISTRHLVAALLTPIKGDFTGSRVLKESDDIEASPLFWEFNEFLKTDDRVVLHESVDVWQPVVDQLRSSLPPSKRPEKEPPEAAPTGGRNNPSRRHHPDELCLDIDRYAEASAQLLKNASDESDFVFALFGPWGRGKTTLAEEIQARIQKKGYVCVHFCAWKYPSRPEIWIHIYEEILRRAQIYLGSDNERADLESTENESWLQRLRISFRVGVLSQGWSPLVLGSILLLLSRLPWLDFSLDVARAIGWSGAILLAAFAVRSMGWVKVLRFQYGTLPTHRDKLGLQSVVGQDLASLLKVWISPKGVSVPKPLKKFWLLWISAGAVCFACILGAVGVFDHALRASQTGTKPSSPHEPVSETISSFGDLVAAELPDFLAWPFRTIDSAHFEPISTGLWIGGILVLVGSVFLLMAVLIRLKPQTFERLLLIVDDLDRCEPDQMLAVVESLRVFLDKTEMSSRMQILMLIDDRKLDQAILKRAYEQQWMPGTPQDRAAYCREQREKYFVSSIQLTPLDKDDISDITTKLLNREANQDEAERAKELKKREEANKQAIARNEKDVSTTRVKTPARTMPHSLGSRMPKTEVTEVEPEIRRPATEEEREQERKQIRRNKEKAKAEEEERKRIEDEFKRRTTNRLSKDINEKTKFEFIERQLLQEWVHEQADEHTSPRTIRTLITRYLLARLMISTFGFDPDARTLLSALSGKPIEANLEGDELRAYQRVAATLDQSSFTDHFVSQPQVELPE